MITDHGFHDAAEDWLEGHDDGVASCPITQGTLLRALIRTGSSSQRAQEALRSLLASLSHTFWRDDLSYLDVRLTGVVGHRQVTDAYLAALARQRAAHPGPGRGRRRRRVRRGDRALARAR